MVEIQAVLDACVLYSFYLRKIFMRLDGEEELYHAHWSNEINDEWKRNLIKNKPYLEKKDLDATIFWMNKAIDDALVHSYKHHEKKPLLG